ncbi:MAG: nicotinamide riboside transporter PnuC, partial [Bacteroidales bacterium]|nr:nicotinamide riboside transporter PnuC [Bacteroidales bacterium]
MDYTEIFGAITGTLFVILEIKQKKSMWIVGGISALVYIVVFFNSSLYAAAGVQLYFAAASIYGWYVWRSREGDEGSSDPEVVSMPLKVALISSGIAFLGFLLLWYLLAFYSNDPAPLADALIAALSMLATFWVSHKFIQHWFLWIVANFIAIYIYFSHALYATTALYFIYLIAAFAGW